MDKLFLLVDDDIDDADLFQYALKKADTSVCFEHVNSANRLFDFLGNPLNKKPDFIFLDLNMPKVNGFQCLKQLKNSQEYKSIPVIIYSTTSHDTEKTRAKENGASGFLTKPTNLQILAADLENLAKGKLTHHLLI